MSVIYRQLNKARGHLLQYIFMFFLSVYGRSSVPKDSTL